MSCKTVRSLHDLRANSVVYFKAKVINYPSATTKLSEVNKGSNLKLCSCWREICLASYGTVSLQCPSRSDFTNLTKQPLMARVVQNYILTNVEINASQVGKCKDLGTDKRMPACREKGEKAFFKRNYTF